ncbi:hypothetical protein GCWU000342_01536 [Shuttleworthella satelles DSM 14600]|uniref:Uncharacterized protein n=1 Tax=Shuttleworthella satelles DSM 14600 TaxID=626523 RepID=C4GC49_9FIRM|nr:hypothetical protein GCWU000342_01536 [Shuttleworthia satelles DSM 14600]
MRELSLSGRAYRANCRAGTARDASLLIYDVLGITGADCGYRALGLAGSTADTIIRNNVCHLKTSCN